MSINGILPTSPGYTTRGVDVVQTPREMELEARIRALEDKILSLRTSRRLLMTLLQSSVKEREHLTKLLDQQSKRRRRKLASDNRPFLVIRTEHDGL